MSTRRAWMCAAAAAGACATFLATAQSLKRVGVLFFGPPEKEPGSTAFGQGMRELGYVDGLNVVIEYRYAEGRPERLAPLAAELVQAKVDVILTGGPGPFVAVRRATSTVPIVAVGGSDPVGNGWAQSLARPGGQVTGLLVTFPGLESKRLGLIKEAFPEIVRVAVLLAPAELPGAGREVMDQLEDTARRLGIQLQRLDVRKPSELEPALHRAAESRAQAVLAIETAIVVSLRSRLVEAAAREQLPVSGEFNFIGTEGLLMTYGPDLNDLLRRSAGYVDRILKGAKPGDLPIERPTKIDLTVNLKTARALGLSFPRALLLRADRIVE